MGRFLESVLKLILFMAFAPFLLALALHYFVLMLAAVLPLLVLLGAVAGVAAGLTAGLILRRRLPPPDDGRALPPPFPRHQGRRPGGGADWR